MPRTRKVSRTAASVALWLAALAVGPATAAGVDAPVLVITEPGVDAYAEALRGLQSGLDRPPLVLGVSDGAAIHGALAGSPPLVIALGSDAFAALAAAHTQVPVLLAMVLDQAARGGGVPLAGTISLDLTPAQVLDEVSALFPEKVRIGVIRNPKKSPWMDAAALSYGHGHGFTIHVVDCASAEDLLPAFLSLRAKADFVIALPDSTLYNSVTIKPLILASLQNRLPLIGFSAAFVRSGAAMGVYPDFEDIGRQTAEAARRILGGRPGSVHEGARRHIVAVTQRVLRLLGMDSETRKAVVVFK